MFEVVICTVSTGRVRRKFFKSWDAARECVDSVTEKKGASVRVWLERVETPAQTLILRPVRTIAA
ncbi:MAG: hypothetical protein L0241_17010 [Planctomycetia bacterium]|nr:hypothetical protein [Planctomycetia bacterium]